ncbi:MAG TPA: STAS domain-containing protein [Candidatus Competibacteraceae bacterium]|nr:STAS domain-containing protein [Candidatus Competibacteraceae bacterium]
MDYVVYLEPSDKIMMARVELKHLTADVAHQIFAEILQAARGTQALAIDLATVDFIDSTAIGELVFLGKKLRNGGIACTIAGLKPHLMGLVRMMRLETIMHFSEDADAGIKGLVNKLKIEMPNS